MGTITASRMEAPSTGNDIEERKIATNKEMEKNKEMDVGRGIRDLHHEINGVVYFKTELPLHFFPNLDGRTHRRRRRI